MKDNEQYIQKIQTNLEQIENELIRYKVRGIGFTGRAKDRHEERVEQMELMIGGMHYRLSNFKKADERLWAYLQDSIGKKLQELQAFLENATLVFTEESEKRLEADIQGNDDSPYPPGEGLNRFFAKH